MVVAALDSQLQEEQETLRRFGEDVRSEVDALSREIRREFQTALNKALHQDLRQFARQVEAMFNEIVQRHTSFTPNTQMPDVSSGAFVPGDFFAQLLGGSLSDIGRATGASSATASQKMPSSSAQSAEQLLSLLQLGQRNL